MHKIDSQIRLRVSETPQDLLIDLKKQLTLKNPLYETIKRLGNTKALYACKRDFKYYKEKDGYFTCGRGVYEQIRARVRLQDERTWSPLPSVRGAAYPAIKLRDYQEGVIEQILLHTEGVAKLGTGFGKTIIALELARRLDTHVLILVTRANIFDQFVRDHERFFGQTPGKIRGRVCTLERITIASIQTLGNYSPGELHRIVRSFGACLVDECHQFITPKRLRVLQQIPSRLFYGLSATPRRSDGQGDAVFFTFGPIRVEKALPQEAPNIQILKNKSVYFAFEYKELIDLQIEDQRRNGLIAEKVKSLTEEGRKVLVLTKRIRHFEALQGLIGSARCITPKTPQEVLVNLRTDPDSFSVLLGTYSLLATGVDIPALDTLVLAGDLRSDVLAEQSAGRILRLLKGKQTPLIIDIEDQGHGMLLSQARQRRKFYQQNNWLYTYV